MAFGMCLRALARPFSYGVKWKRSTDELLSDDWREAAMA